MIRRPPRSTQSRSSAASDVYKRQEARARARGPQDDRGLEGLCAQPLRGRALTKGLLAFRIVPGRDGDRAREPPDLLCERKGIRGPRPPAGKTRRGREATRRRVLDKDRDGGGAPGREAG